MADKHQFTPNGFFCVVSFITRVNGLSSKGLLARVGQEKWKLER